MGYAVRLTKDEGLPTMVKRGAGFVRRRFFGKRARYLPGKKVLEAQAAEMVGKTAENCGLPTISILTPLYNTPENYLREFLDSFVNQTAPNGQLCLADASDDAHPEVERVVREYQRKNQRIVYKKVENKGHRHRDFHSRISNIFCPVVKARSQGLGDHGGCGSSHSGGEQLAEILDLNADSVAGADIYAVLVDEKGHHKPGNPRDRHLDSSGNSQP